MIYKGVRTCSSVDSKSWREWLDVNHQIEKSVWLIIYHKDSQKASVLYEDAVKEALCYGWIDCKVNKRNKESYYLFFSKRNPKSNWSAKNRKSVEELIKTGKMTAQGLEMVQMAKESGSWTALDDVENIILHKDLVSAFKNNRIAKKNFDEFPPSSKKIILSWIYTAKKDETRNRRIVQTIKLAEKNIRANHVEQ